MLITLELQYRDKPVGMEMDFLGHDDLCGGINIIADLDCAGDICTCAAREKGKIGTSLQLFSILIIRPLLGETTEKARPYKE